MKKITLTITFDPASGAVNVSGPIQDRILCLGMLELAKEAMAAEAKRQASQILIARPKVVV